MRPLVALGVGLIACQPHPVASPADEPIARAAAEAALARLDTMSLRAPYPRTFDAIGITLDSLTTGQLDLHDNFGRVVATRGTTTCSGILGAGVVKCEQGK